jgi:hypothetical protein
MLWIGYGFLTICLFSSLKSDIVHTVWSFSRMMKEGKAHLDDGCHFNTPINIKRSISFIRVALCIFGIGYGLPWYGLAPSYNSKETGSNFQSPSMPSKSSSNLRSNTRSKLRCDVLRCTHLFFTMLGRSALSYLASKISTMHLEALRVLAGSWAKLKLSLSALEMLGLSCRLLIFLMGNRISSMVMVLSVKSNTASISCKVCLPIIRSYNGGGPPLEYSTMSGCRCTFLLAEYSTKESLTSPTFLVLKVSLEVLHDYGTALFTMGMYLLDPFSKKRRSPLDPVSRRTLIVLCLTISLSLVSFGGGSASFRHFLDQFRSNFFDLDSNLVFLALILALSLIDLLLVLPYKCITTTTTVTFPVFAFSRAFTSALSLFRMEL